MEPESTVDSVSDASSGTRRQPATTAGPRPVGQPGERAIDQVQDPVASGGDGVLHFPAAIRGYLCPTGPPAPLPHAISRAPFAARPFRPATSGSAFLARHFRR